MARDPTEAHRKVPFVIEKVVSWLSEHGLKIAAAKTEVVVLTRQMRFSAPFTIEVDGAAIEAEKDINYLGITLDRKISYWPIIARAADKAGKTVAALTRIIPKIVGARTSKRRILMGVVHSILLYGAEIWAETLKVKK